jgi:hypothetical protein
MMYDIVRCFVLFVITIGNCNIIIVNLFLLFVIAIGNYKCDDDITTNVT